MADTRKANVNWRIGTNPDGTTPSKDAHLATLMDIRDELQAIRRRLDCHETLAMPGSLRRIERNTRPSAKCRRKHLTDKAKKS